MNGESAMSPFVEQLLRLLEDGKVLFFCCHFLLCAPAVCDVCEEQTPGSLVPLLLRLLLRKTLNLGPCLVALSGCCLMFMSWFSRATAAEPLLSLAGSSLGRQINCPAMAPKRKASELDMVIEKPDKSKGKERAKKITGTSTGEDGWTTTPPSLIHR